MGFQKIIFSVLFFGVLFISGIGFAQSESGSAAPPIAASEDKEAKLADIRELVRLTGGGNMGKQFIEQMINSMKTTSPNVPEQFWNDFVSEINVKELEDLNVPIYDKYLAHEDIKGLIVFYQSPLGQRFIGALPQIMQEAYMVGEKWGTDIADKVIQRMKEKGYLEKQNEKSLEAK